MLTEQRHEIILQKLKEKGSVTVTELKELLETSESTIRRDLIELDHAGRLTKVFGGAVASDNAFSARELSVAQKSGLNHEEKKRIAEYAASLIEPGDFVFLDAGTTTECMLEFLHYQNVTYVTNAISHARQLAVEGHHVILLGGEIKGTTEAVVGSQAMLSLQDYHFMKGFFGTNGISVKCGYTTPDQNEALIKKTAFSQCLKRYVLADSNKFGAVSSVTFAPINGAEIITGEKPAEKYEQQGNIILV